MFSESQGPPWSISNPSAMCCFEMLRDCREGIHSVEPVRQISDPTRNWFSGKDVLATLPATAFPSFQQRPLTTFETPVPVDPAVHLRAIDCGVV